MNTIQSGTTLCARLLAAVVNFTQRRGAARCWAGYPRCVIAPDAGAKNGGRRRKHQTISLLLAIRRWHWGNALLFVLLLLSGGLSVIFSRPCSANGAAHTVWFCLLAFSSGFVLINSSPQ